MENSLDSIWAQILQNIRKRISPQSYETWFVPTKQVAQSDKSITIEVPNKFFKDWLVEHYKERIVSAAEELGKKGVEIEFAINEHSVAKEADEGEGEKKGLGFLTRPFERFMQSPQELAFNRRYTFESFVVGGCNRFTHAAALAVAEKPAKAYNPLFIYGGVGLGKTHIMQAIGQHTVKTQPRLKVLYMSSEKFTNQLINAIQNRTTQKFRDKYRTLDILLIDDIQFISGKESTQEEFFHTFNTLYDAHKQIVVSSDRPPKEISALEKRLVSRFEWGLVTDMQLPDLETRMAILRKKLESEVTTVSDDVLFFIADNIKSNIRELEGALIRIIAYASLIGKSIDLGVAKEVLKEAGEQEASDIGVELIQRVVADYFDIGTTEMRSKKRTKKIVYPRQIAMYLARELTGSPLVEIGGLFGGRDHTTVMHACGKIEEDIKKNPHIKGMVDNIITKIRTSK
ncbi:MAG: chromosomal replication initiator protein DnaA [Candidatus Omnitrophica bacterium]|nr:chromosomal replication initiator protein DnaA [Candidatus Omnitrophota bacterium]